MSKVYENYLFMEELENDQEWIEFINQQTEMTDEDMDEMYDLYEKQNKGPNTPIA